MKKNFSDYSIYDIPEVELTSHQGDFSVIVFGMSNVNSKEREKILQILSVIDIPPEKVKIYGKKLSTILQYHNALKDAKVTKGLIFKDKLPAEGQIQYNSIIASGKEEIIFSYSILQLMEDEKNKIVERRKALWLTLKKWK